MAQGQSAGGIIAGTTTVLGIGLVWLSVVGSFPSAEELSAVSPPVLVPPAASPVPSSTPPPTLDLTIPKSAPFPSEVAEPRQEARPAAVTQLNPRAVEVAKLRCEAEIEEICPESRDGAGRKRCLEQKGKQLSPLCQNQVRERFVKWREDRSRVLEACEEDMKRFCQTDKPGGGLTLQCLQSHAPEVSDRCYRTLPKGEVYFK